MFQVPVKIGRAFKTEKSSSRNAYFDCKVGGWGHYNSRIVIPLNCHTRCCLKLTLCSCTRVTRVASFFSTRAAATEPSSTTSGSASRGARVNWRSFSPGTSWGLARMFWTSLGMWLRRASSWRSRSSCRWQRPVLSTLQLQTVPTFRQLRGSLHRNNQPPGKGGGKHDLCSLVFLSRLRCQGRSSWRTSCWCSNLS